MAICQEGVVSWFSMASQSQHLQLSTLRQAATTFLLQAQQANAVALMIRPSLSGSLTWNEPFDDDDNNRPDTAFNRGLSTLTLPTITRYALVLARAIQFLINLHGDAVSLPTDDELCALDPSQVAHTVCDYLLLSEWPNNVQQPKIGPLAQAAIALSLKDIRGPAHSSTPVTSSRHLGLVSAPELASISSALMSAIKSAIVLARVFNSNQAFSFQNSASATQLAKIRRLYGELHTAAANTDVMIDEHQSAVRGTLVLRIVHEARQPVYVWLNEICNAVNHALAHCANLFRQLLNNFQLPQDVVLQLVSFSSPTMLFKPNGSTLADFSADQTLAELCTEHHQFSIINFGLDLCKVLQQQLRVSDDQFRQSTLKIMSKLQPFLVFLTHVVSGAPGRSADLLNLSFRGTADDVCIVHAQSENQLRIVTLIHKHATRQAGSLKSVQRHPTYSVGVALSLWSTLRTAMDKSSSLWLPGTKEIDILDNWRTAALTCFMFHMDWNHWRFVAQFIISEYAGDIQAISNELRSGSGLSYSTINEVDYSSVARTSASALLSQGFGHTLSTANSHYLATSTSNNDWLFANVAYQRLLQLRERIDVAASQPQASMSLVPDETTSGDEKSLFALELLETVYHSTSFRSKVQETSVQLMLEGTHDMIVISGCGSGKSALFLTAAEAARRQQKAVFVLCPRSDVVQAASALAKDAALPVIVFGDSDATTTSFIQDAIEGTLRFCLLIATFDNVADSGILSSLIESMQQRQMLSRIIVDEVHVVLQSVSWRHCFSTCGNLQSLFDLRVPWILTSATLPMACVSSVVDFFTLGFRPIEVVKGDTGLAPNLSFNVQRVDRDLFATAAQMLRATFHQDNPQLPRRMMVLVLTRHDMVSMLNAIERDDDLVQLGAAMFSSETDFHSAEVQTRLANDRILICTTILSSAVNLVDLDEILIIGSQYSLIDVLQAVGRIGRDGHVANATLLFSDISHSIVFGQPGSQKLTDSYSSPLTWAGPLIADSKLRAAFTPEGVKQLSQFGGCRRNFFANYFDGVESGDTNKTCLQLRLALCDVCRQQPGRTEEVTTPSYVAATDDRDDDSSAVMYATSMDDDYNIDARQDTPTGSVQVFSIAAERQLYSEDGVSAIAHSVFATLKKAITDLTQRSNGCFMCGETKCNGFRNEASGYRPCAGRTKMAGPWPNGPICFACSGAHMKTDCPYRHVDLRKIEGVAVPRCFFCMLPQHEIEGISFHENAVSCGGEESKRRCRALGDKIFPVLCASYAMREAQWANFMQTWGSYLQGTPPTLRVQEFHKFMAWLFLPSPTRCGLLNLDILLSFVLPILSTV